MPHLLARFQVIWLSCPGLQRVLHAGKNGLASGARVVPGKCTSGGCPDPRYVGSGWIVGAPGQVLDRRLPLERSPVLVTAFLPLVRVQTPQPIPPSHLPSYILPRSTRSAAAAVASAESHGRTFYGYGVSCTEQHTVGLYLASFLMLMHAPVSSHILPIPAILTLPR